MGLPVTPRLTSGTPDLTRSADLIKKALDPLLRDPFLFGRIIEDIDVTAAETFVVNHGLGRAWTGYELVSATGDAMVVLRTASVSPTPNANTQIALVSSATATITLRVF